MYEIIRRRINTIIPLNRLLGIEIASIGDGSAEAHLEFRPEITNHIGTVHATATFGLAEAASGCAVAGLLAHRVTRVRLVALGSSIEFHRTARAALVATAQVTTPPALLRERFSGGDRVDVEVAVSVRDATGVAIASSKVSWRVSERRR